MDNDTRTGDTRTGLGTAAKVIGPDRDANPVGFAKDYRFRVRQSPRRLTLEFTRWREGEGEDVLAFIATAGLAHQGWRYHVFRPSTGK